MLENMKKRKKTSSIAPNKVITKVSLPQEGDTREIIGKFIIDVNKLVDASNVIGKTTKVAIEEEYNLGDVNT
jgi:hypothetical protein